MASPAAELDLERVVATTLELCAVAAPTGEEGARADEVERRLRALGLRADRDAAGNVLCALSPAADGPPAVISAHLDTVFARDVALAPRRDGDVLRGPGIGDDTLAVAALLELAAARAADPPPGGLLLAFTVGEEGLGDLRGIKHVLATVGARIHVALEGHGLDELVTAAIGSVRLRAGYAGPGGHSWGDRGTPSAVHAAVIAGAAALAAVPAGRHVNVGTVAGGTTVNAIAAHAELLVDLRDPDPARLEDTVARVEDALRAVGDPGVTASLERVGDRPAGALEAGHALVALVQDARAAAGLPPAREEASSTETNAALGAGVPSACVGLTRGADAHRTTEHVELAPLRSGLAVLAALADGLPTLDGVSNVRALP